MSNEITRRQALKTGVALGAGAVLGSARTKDAAAAKRPQVPRRTLGKTGKKVPILLFGGSMYLDPVSDIKLREAFSYGVSYFDAARVYAGGRCESAMGAYMKRAKNRNKIWITSKSQAHDPAGFERQLQISLRELGTSWVDLYFMHALRNKRHLSKEMGKMAEKLKKAGKLRHVGFSCHHGNVAELLTEAAKHSWIDVIMFRYNFRTYGDKQLNKAIDAAAKANIGLIAMKTQGAASSFKSKWVKFKKTGKWTKHQAVLKAVWADRRITAAVSHMDTLTKLRQNIAAATNRTKLSVLEGAELERYAAASRAYACDGCDHICGAAVSAPVRIGDTLRYLMYHDEYDQQREARELFAALPAPARAIGSVDFGAAARACPHGVDIPGLMKRAARVLG